MARGDKPAVSLNADLRPQRHSWLPEQARSAGGAVPCRREGRCRKFVFLGDYIDRGPDSRGVLEFVIGLQRRMPSQVICLCGNHEDLALNAIDDPRQIDQWVVYNGGDKALASYGVTRPSEVPADHVAWLRALADAPRRRPAVLRPRRHRSRPAARPAGPARSALDARAVSLRSARLRPLHRARPHAVAGRPARPAGQPRQHRHRRGAGRAADGGGVRRQQAPRRSGFCRKPEPYSPSSSAQYFLPDDDVADASPYRVRLGISMLLRWPDELAHCLITQAVSLQP